MRVAILGTGRMELKGLPPALKRLFPDHEFYPVYENEKDLKPFDSFTSSGQPLALGQANPNLALIVEEMASTLVPGRKEQPPDLLFVLEDLELPNRHQPEVVVRVFREATERHVAGLRSSRPNLADKVAQALRSKASFHLATPMIESWLFADPEGPLKAKVPPERLPPDLERERDPEDFLTRDPSYLADNGSACTAWRGLPPHRAKRNSPGWCKVQREVHPKAFLQWLCRDPQETNCTRYRESHEGAGALSALDWAQALRVPEHCTYLRALVEDLADGLGESLADLRESIPHLGESLCCVSPHTSHRTPRPAPMLRNI